MNRICVIIPMFGKEDYTNRCVDLTIKNSGVPVDILVVDDGSKNPYERQDINVIRLDTNSGFTNAANQGILWAQRRDYELVHLLNNDTEPNENFIVELLNVLDRYSDVGIATSARVHDDPSGTIIELFGVDLLRGFQAVIKPELLDDENTPCNWAPLCSSLMRMDMIREIGLLDKKMRNHSSDLDYCLRSKIAGFNHIVVPKSKVVHHHQVTTSEYKLSPEHDQQVLLEKLSGLNYAQFLNVLPLDHESKTYGKLEFSVYKK